MTIIDDTFYNALPSGVKAKKLNLAYREKLIQSFTHLVGVSSTSLKINLSDVQKTIESINVKRKFSPKLFALHSKLFASLNNADITSTIDSLKELSLLNDKSIYDNKMRISSILTEDWEADFVSHMRKEIIESKGSKPFIIHPILNEYFEVYRQSILEFEKILKTLDKDFFSEYIEYPTRLKFFHGRTLIGASAVRVYGAIYLRTPDRNENYLSYFAEHLTHEVSHLHLYSLLAHDPLILNPTGTLYNAPIRSDKRPLYGIMHATFVLSRMVRVFRLMYMQNNNRLFLAQLNKFRKQLKGGIKTLNENAKFTEKGMAVFKTINDCAES